MVTAYNVAVAVAALALVFLVHRVDAARVLGAGLIVFLGASIACASAGSLSFLIGASCVQGVGAALLLAGSLPVLAALTGSSAKRRGPLDARGDVRLGARARARRRVDAGVRLARHLRRPGPCGRARAAGHAFAPHPHCGRPGRLAAVARRARCRRISASASLRRARRALLFLAVLLVITVWGYSPIGGAALVSARSRPPPWPSGRWSGGCRAAAVWGGAALLASGLVGLALLPSARRRAGRLGARALRGRGSGSPVPLLSQAALDLHAGLSRSGTLTVGVRHLGLVLALVSIAPLLASEVPKTGDKALLKATAVLLDSPAGLDKEGAGRARPARSVRQGPRRGDAPISAKPFNKHGARDDSALAETRDKLVGTIEATITRAFRPAFFLSAAFAALAPRRRGALPPEAALVTRLTPALAILAALLAAVLALVAVEFGKGAAEEPGRRLRTRATGVPLAAAAASTRRSSESSSTGSTGPPAACTRLVRSSCSRWRRRPVCAASWSDHTIEVALRAGMLRADRRGRAAGATSPDLRRAVRPAARRESAARQARPRRHKPEQPVRLAPVGPVELDARCRAGSSGPPPRRPPRGERRRSAPRRARLATTSPPSRYSSGVRAASEA